MKLIGAITTKGPRIDERLKNKISVLSTTPLSDKDAIIMGLSLWAVAEQLETDKLLDKITHVNCIFTKDGEVSLKLDDHQFGNVSSLIIYPIEKWNTVTSTINPDYPTFLFIIEELAHHYWNITDEVEVNFKVIEIMRRIYPNLQIHDVYSKDFMDNPTY